MTEQNYLFVKTKFSPPDFHSRHVEREGILKTLESNRDKRLTLICAPAGYGKTSLMAQYYQHLLAANCDVTWLSLDKYDADLGRFLLYVIHAIRQLIPDFAESLLSILQAGFTDSPELVSVNFNDAVATLEKPVFLFIDDFYLAETAEISSALKDILLGAQQLRCIISTRHTPQGLALSRLRMLDEINEVDQESLRFSQQESSQFFTKTLNIPIRPDLAGQLTDKAEGWAAGMQLASISLRNSDDPDRFIKNFTGENRSIGEFLADEILGNLPEETQDFLIKCSLLPRFNYQLCDAIFDNHNSAKHISRLREDHLFVISLDEVDYWFRFHHLFSQYLRKKANEIYPDSVSTIHSKASLWHESQGFYTDAIEHAIESGDHNHAADILDKISAELFYQGKISLLESYADALSDEVVRLHPSQQMDRIWQWIITWRFDKARIALSQVRQVLNDYKGNSDIGPQELNFLESKYAHREMSYAFFTDATKEAQPLAEHWLLHHLNDDLSMVSSAKTMLMVSERDQFVLHDIAAKVDALHELHVEANFPYGVVKGDCLCGATLMMKGHLDRALDFFERAKAAAVQLHGEFAPLTAMPCLHIADIYYEKADIEAAEALVKKYLPLSQSFGFAENIIVGYLTKARIEFSQNNSSAALKTLESGRKAALATGFERLRTTMSTEHIRQLLINGDKTAAFSLARAIGISGGASRYLPSEESDRIHLLEALAWVRVNVAMSNPNSAIRVLTHWVNHLKDRNCTREALRCAILLADIHYNQEDTISARQYLSYALGEAAQLGFCRIFPDEGPSLAPLLKQYKPGTDQNDYSETIEKILAAYKTIKPQTSFNAASKYQPDIDVSEVALSERELEILNLCKIDKSNAEIAAALSITEGTVKWYWQSIFNKLGVRRRRQAVIVASDMGLLVS